jgi:hypothetical protein
LSYTHRNSAGQPGTNRTAQAEISNEFWLSFPVQVNSTRSLQPRGLEIGGRSLTVQREDGKLATYDPKRLQGITACREREREFAQGDRIQFTAPDRNRRVATASWLPFRRSTGRNSPCG